MSPNARVLIVCVCVIWAVLASVKAAAQEAPPNSPPSVAPAARIRGGAGDPPPDHVIESSSL